MQWKLCIEDHKKRPTKRLFQTSPIDLTQTRTVGSKRKPRSIREAFERLFDRVESGCWEWQGALRDKKYGNFRGKLAHRVSFEIYKGRIPAGKILLHTCNNPACVNPDHLIAGTHEQNAHHRSMEVLPKL